MSVYSFPPLLPFISERASRTCLLLRCVMSMIINDHQGGRLTQVQLPCAQLHCGLEHDPQPPMVKVLVD
jgi:hypothetical protein